MHEPIQGRGAQGRLRALLGTVTGGDPRGGRLLGYYLLGVARCQLGSGAWDQFHTGELGWFRFGLTTVSHWVLNEETPVTPYYLAILWLFALALLMIRGRLPLKTYVFGELVLGSASALFLRMDLSAHPDSGTIRLAAAFLFETVIPVVWAVTLLWRKWRRSPRVLVPGTRTLGYYLLAVSLYPVIWFAAVAWFDRFSKTERPDWLLMLQPRLGLTLTQSLLEEALNGLEIPLYVYLVLWCFGLLLAVLLILGRQPLKTYVISEGLLGFPEAVVAAIFVVSGQLQQTNSTGARLAVLAVFLFESAIPVGCAIRLLWRRRKLTRALAAG